jgi:glycosyltransferase involved in cell wall biosynthesis
VSTVLSLIVPSKNRQDYLKQFVASLPAHLPPEFEVILYDNSADHLDSSIEEKVGIKYFHDPEQISVGENFSRALNKAVGKYAAFIGDDDEVDSAALEEIIPVLAKHDYDSVVSPIFDLIFHEGTQTKWSGEFLVKTKIRPTKIGRFLIGAIFQASLVSRRLVAFWGLAPDLWSVPRGYFGIFRTQNLRGTGLGARAIYLSPDMYMMGVLSSAKNILHFSKQIFIPGTSSTSTSNLSNKRQHIGKISEQKHLDKQDLEKLPQALPDSFFPEVIWFGSYLAGKGLTSLSRKNFLLLEKYIQFKYGSRIVSDVYENVSIVENIFYKLIAALIFLGNRFFVSLLIFGRYYFSKREE